MSFRSNTRTCLFTSSEPKQNGKGTRKRPFGRVGCRRTCEEKTNGFIVRAYNGPKTDYFDTNQNRWSRAVIQRFPSRSRTREFQAEWKTAFFVHQTTACISNVFPNIFLRLILH